MKINLLLNENLIMLDLNICNKEKAIKKLINRLYEEEYITSQEIFYKDIKTKEDRGYISVGNGIIIPHAQSKAVNRASLSILRTSNDLNCKGIDGKAANLFFMIAVPEDKPDMHLSILSRLSRKLIYSDFREAILNAKSSKEIMLIMRGERRVG